MDAHVAKILNAAKSAIESNFQSSLKKDRIAHVPGFANCGIALRYNLSVATCSVSLIELFARELIAKLPLNGVLNMRDQPLIPECKRDSAILLTYPHGLVSVDFDTWLQQPTVGARLEFDYGNYWL